MKTISILIPTYNEQDNVRLIYERVKNIFEKQLPNYQYEIVYIDNYSRDNTRAHLLALAQVDDGVKAIFNAKNFGFTRSTFYGITQTTGDCTILLFADMQDPPELIPEFVREWEQGNKIVIGVKNTSKENKFMYWIRSCYYKFIETIAEVDHIQHFTGFGLYDKTFVEILKELNDPMPYLRGIVAELGFERKELYYEQRKREHGKTSFNFFKLYDVAMLGITSYSKVIMRIATMLGFATSIISLGIAAITIIMKLANWNKYPMGTAAILTGTFLIGSIQLFFIGFLGEYILNINTRVMNRPLVVEERRLNFKNGLDKDSEDKKVS